MRLYSQNLSSLIITLGILSYEHRHEHAVTKMELTLEQALQQGVEAHKAGKVQEADRYYTAVLKVNPKHPDANHNMGVLAVGVGKVEEALPFFKIALESNLNIAQYWLSYIDALIKLNRFVDAKTVLGQAKSKGAKGDGFDQLESKLFEIRKNSKVNATSLKSKEPSKEDLQRLIYLYTQGQFQEVLTKALQLLKKFPKSLNLYNIIGTANKELGKLEEAIDAYNEAISIKSDYAEAYNNLGVTFQAQGKLDEALGAYKKAVSIKPDYAEAHQNIGNALKDQSKLEGSIDAYKEAVSIKPDYAEAHNNMGVTLQEQGKLDAALEAYNTALSVKPDYAEVYNNMGVTFQAQGKLEKAIEAYCKALSLKPDYTQVYNNVGNALQEQGKLDEALGAYKKAVSIKPDCAQAYNKIGFIFRDQGKLDKAVEAYKNALSIKPDYAEAYNNIGITLKDQGKLDEALEAYKKALSIKPNYTEAHRNLSFIKTYTLDDVQFLQVQEYYHKEDLSDDEKCQLSFALAKMFEDVGEKEKSFKCLFTGNSLRKKLLNYSIYQDKSLFSKLKKTQSHLLTTSLKIKEKTIEATPIFILGMPRSGTTLVEQIISSHSKVTGAGELNYIARFGGNLVIDTASINNTAITKFRDRYLLDFSKISYGKQYVTDKTPQNFLYIPLICAAFPEAEIIHVQRSAAATCWSNYKQYFVSNNLGYCYDLNDLVEYYNLYLDLMKIWQTQYSERIYNLSYENLTNDQENETRKLVKHLGLNWENTCLSPHKNKRSIKTASQLQVRKKVYKGSSYAWQKYKPYLKGVFDNLPSV